MESVMLNSAEYEHSYKCSPVKTRHETNITISKCIERSRGREEENMTYLNST